MKRFSQWRIFSERSTTWSPVTKLAISSVESLVEKRDSGEGGGLIWPHKWACQRGADRSAVGGGPFDSPQIHQNHSLTSPGAASGPIWRSWWCTLFPRHSSSPIMLLICSPLLVSFHLHAKVLASLINRSGHLVRSECQPRQRPLAQSFAPSVV